MENQINTSQNNRTDQRHHAFWKIYHQDNPFGYLVDLSQSGIKAWIKSHEKVPEGLFHIRLNPPKKVSDKPVEFEVEQVWCNTFKGNRLIEIGCQFTNLSQDKKEILDQLITFFDKLND